MDIEVNQRQGLLPKLPSSTTNNSDESNEYRKISTFSFNQTINYNSVANPMNQTATNKFMNLRASRKDSSTSEAKYATNCILPSLKSPPAKYTIK